MKKLFSLAVVVAAMFCTSSCEGLIDAFLNNYFVGDECVLSSEEAEFDFETVPDVYLFSFKSKAEGSNDYYSIGLLPKHYKEALSKEGCADLGDMVCGGTAKEGKRRIMYMGVTALDSDLANVYDAKSGEISGTLKIKEGNKGYYTVTLKAVLTLKEIADATKTKDFTLDLNYHGTPKMKGAPQK